ncbi:FGGY-family carbohydrate kinase [Litoreibacter roseus]|uniref:Carbohydrate kinase n=1 Tax=Litoreibacter roseus TaxID=2601869 RepID=A0A6N6JKK4_9RHOB|nr:FGGY-family carbohydrate kinase [Litoreibacter roseus]GFE66467.1 carbohydrate kinase [Litoreibacter roseus]
MIIPQHVAVIDIGKTNAKLALVDMQTLTEVTVVTRPNTVLSGPPWPHFDTEGHWAFLLDGLKTFHETHRIDAISITTHGASIVLLDKNGNLAAPILDYEHPIPAECAAKYDALRPPFSKTGSPRLAAGLNVGAQLHWQFANDPDLYSRTAHIIGYPQYWAHRLTGAVANDVTSIGCHTDLWMPREGRLSDLAETLDISQKIAPVRKPADVLGSIRPDIALKTGLSPETPVLCGIHDSNASLYCHLLTQDKDFSVVSTGTWVVVMTMGGTAPPLDPRRDTLMNVNALGDMVPSARFMGGREFELIQGDHPFEPTDRDATSVLTNDVMLLPSVEADGGPYPGRKTRWIGSKPENGSGIRSVALSYYLALMTETCLRLTGASDRAIVEGPFARNIYYLAMLSAVRGHPVLRSQSATGTSIGAALLYGRSEAIPLPDRIERPPNFTELSAYAERWFARVTS